MNQNNTWEITDENEWNKIIPEIWKAHKQVSCWLLSGELGAGKTTFVKSLLKYLGSQDIISSPTFSIVQEYAVPSTDKYALSTIYHLDLYRLEESHEAEEIGLPELLDQPFLKLIEWPAIIEPYWPLNTLHLHFEHLEKGRQVTVVDNSNQ